MIVKSVCQARDTNGNRLNLIAGIELKDGSVEFGYVNQLQYVDLRVNEGTYRLSLKSLLELSVKLKELHDEGVKNLLLTQHLTCPKD